MIDPF